MATQIPFSETQPERTTSTEYTPGGFPQQSWAYTDFHPPEENPPMFTPTELYTASGVGSLHTHVTSSRDLYQNQFTLSTTIPGEIYQIHTPGSTQGSYASDPAGHYSQVIQPVTTRVGDPNAMAPVSNTIYWFTSMQRSVLLSGLSGPSSNVSAYDQFGYVAQSFYPYPSHTIWSASDI